MEGDDNTKFFHGVMKAHSSASRIHGLVIDGKRTMDLMAIKLEALNHFKSRFTKMEPNRPKYEAANLKCLSSQNCDILISSIHIEKKLKMLYGIGSDSPKTFNFKFIKTYWHILEVDIMELLDTFHASTIIHNCINSSFIALTPKIMTLNSSRIVGRFI